MDARLFRAIVLAPAMAASLNTHPATAQVAPFPATFHARRIATNGTTLYVRVGGTGPAVVLLHGYGETGRHVVAARREAGASHTVIVPDLRGMGLSARPSGGYDKKTQGQDIAGVLDALKIEQGRPGDARHRQHGGLCLRRRISRDG